MSYVASNAVGGYVDLPGESGSNPIQYLALSLITVVMMNVIIAILSESWVNVKEYYLGFETRRKLYYLLNYFHTHKFKNYPVGDTVQIQWF
mmetsp:Transcript_27061/g.23957  ORF Transcript_27061/g.23957 Transcript_27061/m.23957 type:complete len:91 (+) Transcript_27061:1491-1763(+)